ncbi:MAG: hypothetical protein LRY73_18330 [Bacillus sp. (in: Bacteria)]|nr:hypothetical protein [Bacillus sp. (in: firmicutes)]
MSNKYQKLIKNKDDKITQLNQKLLHYRSELEKYKRHIIILSKKGQSVPEEVVETQEKTANDSFLEEFKKKVLPVNVYFSHASFLEGLVNGEKKLDIFGHFTFQNLTDEVIEDPVICIRVKPVGKVNLGGKITVYQSVDTDYSFDQAEQWTYVQKEWQETVNTKGEHWLKPLHFKEIQPFETKKFSNFNISVEHSPEYSHYVVEGFFYARNHKKGIPAVNTISFYL